jgi:hypothetical protein
MTATQATKTVATDAPAGPIEIAIRPGVTTPDWSVVTSGTVRQALQEIFETCDWEQRWAGLDEAEDRTRRAILEAYPRSGHAPSINEIALSTGFAPDQVRDLIAKLKARDMVVLDGDDATLTGAYPFIGRPTEHRVHLGGTVLSAMCAIDALGTGAMLGADAAIESACRCCGTPIRIETSDKGAALKVYSPTSAVVWSGIQYSNSCAADSLCTVMAFFCTDEHLQSWRDAQDRETKGFRLSMDEGLQMGKAIFMPLLAAASTNA